MINITLPDGSKKSFKDAPTGFDIANSISEGLARNSVAVEIDGEIVDLTEKIIHDARLRFITTKDKEALEILRHSAAHVMAQAILHLYQDAKLTIGPVVEDGFYYDIDMEPISKDDFPKIEEQKFWARIFYETAREIFERKVGVHDYLFWQSQRIYQAYGTARLFTMAVRETEPSWSPDIRDYKEFDEIVNKRKS